MPALDVPESGLSLCRDSHGRPPQIMRLNLAQNTLDDLIQSLRNDQPARVRLGKHAALYYGSKSQSFHSFPETLPSEIYSGSSADKENLYFTGILSHSLEVEKAREATAATDQALANLEQSLNAFERGKESKKTHLIGSIDDVRAGRSPSGRQPALLKTSAPNRSMTSSPALGGARSPASIPPPTPTSAPLPQNKDRIRLDALKIPFVHLLAVRAVSTKFLARQTRASPEDCAALAEQYGVKNRINPEKFDLKDRAYKDLDVWKFPYPSQEDRQEAIENAISAFDRMRISRTDKLWQTLLPKEERGKGKCLSRLNLQTGPKKKPETPKIQVQSADDTGKEGYTTGPDTDRTGGSGPTAKGAEPTSAPKTAAGAQKKKAAEKEAAKKPAAKTKTAANSTLTGRITKKAEKKPVVKPDGKFKSAEYVNDSDDDDTDIPDAPALEKPKVEKTKPKAKPASKPIDTTRESSHAPTPKVDTPEAPPSKSESSSQTSSKSISSKRLPAARAPGQKSPQKPSPLGSSPPANASELKNRSRSSSQNNTSSSSSSSPLITQISKPKQTAAKTLPTPAKPVKTNGVVKSAPVTNPLKRKAEMERPAVSRPLAAGRTTGDLEHKRRRAVSTSSGSTGSASPPLGREILLQQLREKSRLFKNNYAKYRTLHDSMAAHPDPPRADLERLQRQHARLQRMKKEIWDEDRRLRDRL